MANENNNQTEIFELATKLGQTLKNDPSLIALEEAKKAYEADPTLQKKLIEYEVQQKAMQGEVAKPERDTHFIDIIQKRIDTLYSEIVANPAFVALNESQAAVNDLMNRVNATIMFQITGEAPSTCTHNCSTCGGNCH